MTKAVRENDAASAVRHIGCDFVALLAFRNVDFQNVVNAQLLTSSLRRVDEVQVIGGVLIVQADEPGLELGFRIGFGSCGGRGTGDCRQNHQRAKSDSQKLLHVFPPE